MSSEERGQGDLTQISGRFGPDPDPRPEHVEQLSAFRPEYSCLWHGRTIFPFDLERVMGNRR